ncbi:MAG: hydrogenase maturation nickel metallochaperone HypA [Bacteroidales bacterium]
MHEVAIVNEMFGIMHEVAEQEKLTRIDKVSFSIGTMMQVVPDLFRFAFDSAKEGTIADNADLEIEFLPVRMKCKQCNTEFNIENNVFRCPDCEGVELDLLQGKELYIKSIEGE